MALKTYDDLLAAYPTLDPELSASDPFDTFLALAEAETFPFVKHFMGETTVDLVVSDDLVEMPDDFTELRTLRVDGKIAIPVSPYGATLHAGQVGYFRSGNNYALVPNTNAPRNVSLTYFASPAPLSATNQTNWMLQKFPNLYVHAILAQAFRYHGNDAQEAASKGRVQEALGIVGASFKRVDQSGNQIIMNDGGSFYGD